MASEMIADMTKSFGDRFALDVQFKMSLTPPTALILFGPSGSGKTTVLRCLAGLEWPERGSIRFGQDTWFDARSKIHLEPQQRRVGYLFQDYALFPTHSVAGNIAYGLSSLPVAERKRRVSEVVALLRLEGMEALRPNQLSGGQQQRVA
ncbi:MAG: Fe3+/spermidine/putrescine ABC transporter ATP-binding protein, partial [Nitrospiraceae bacterium]